MKGPCHNHDNPIKDALVDYDLLKHYLKAEYKPTDKEKLMEPAIKEEEGDAFLDPKGYLVIFSGPTAYESKHKQKLMTREVNTTVSSKEAVPTYLKWSEATITFDRSDHPNHIPLLGRFPLIIDPFIGKMCQTKGLLRAAIRPIGGSSIKLLYVETGGTSGLNLLYAKTYDAMACRK
jgi:hypothetical protein